MANDPREILIAGTGTIYTAPEGTELPQYLSEALDAAFVPAGYITEDGAKFKDAKSVEEVRAWQAFYPVRKFITGRTGSLEFTLMQWNEENLVLAYGGGGIIQPTAGEYRYEPPEPDEVNVRAVVLDMSDGVRNFRFTAGRSFVTNDVESTFAKSGPGLLPITLEILDDADNVKPWRYDTDDAAFAPAAS